MSLRNPFLWKESQKNYLNQEAQKISAFKNHIDTDFVANTKIKHINDNIYTYKAKITNLENILSEKEAELKQKEKIFKDLQRQRNDNIKNTVKKKNSTFYNNERIQENELDKNVKYVSALSSQNNSMRIYIESLRREKKAYQSIEQKITKEIEMLKKNYESADSQLNELVTNRLKLEERFDNDMKVMDKETQLTTMGLLTMQQKLINENKKIKNVFKKDKVLKDLDKNMDDNITVRTNTVEEYNKLLTRPDKSSKKQIKKNTFIIRANSSKVRNNSFTSKKPLKTFKTNKSQKSLVNEEYLIDQEAQIKQRCEQISSLLAFIHTETKTNNIKDLVNYYTNLEEESKDIYKETKAYMDEIDGLKDQKLAMLLEIKNIQSNKEKRMDVKDKIIK